MYFSPEFMLNLASLAWKKAFNRPSSCFVLLVAWIWFLVRNLRKTLPFTRKSPPKFLLTHHNSYSIESIRGLRQTFPWVKSQKPNKRPPKPSKKSCPSPLSLQNYSSLIVKEHFPAQNTPQTFVRKAYSAWENAHKRKRESLITAHTEGEQLQNWNLEKH